MIVVDSSVWIDHLNDVATAQVEEFRALVSTEVVLCLTGVIITEVLRGIRDPEQAALTEHELSAFTVLKLDGIRDYAEAARLYRTARSAGISIRNTADLLIATPCIRMGAWLLHNDRDFDQLATVSGLKIWQPSV